MTQRAKRNSAPAAAAHRKTDWRHQHLDETKTFAATHRGVLLISSLSSADLYLNDSALQLSVTDHAASDAFVLNCTSL
jgi:hypothetical protein